MGIAFSFTHKSTESCVSPAILLGVEEKKKNLKRRKKRKNEQLSHIWRFLLIQ